MTIKVARLCGYVWLHLLVILTSMTCAWGQAKRIALIIGNSNYEHTSSLTNPVNDARLVQSVLKSSGFETNFYINTNLKQMRRAISQLSRRVRELGNETTVVFYYAGHGVQVGQSNYLIPTDAQIASEGDVSIEGLNVAYLLESLSDARAGVNIVILDACRNNPYKTTFRSAGRGLARIDGPPGFLIAFSTDPGRVATDGPEGGNSPYTSSLATSLSTPGLKIEEAFKRVRKEVYNQTKGAQVPWETSSLLSEFYLAGGSPGKPLQRDQAFNDVARAKVAVAEELARASKEAAQAKAARRKAEEETAVARLTVERATAELAKARADAERLRGEAEAESTRSKLKLMERQELARLQDRERERAAERDRITDRAASRADSSQNNQPTFFNPIFLFNPLAKPSFDCGQYGTKPIGHLDRNPQTDVLCIDETASRSDSELGVAFRSLLARFVPSQRRAIVQQQKNWILLRNKSCPASWLDLQSKDRRTEIARCLTSLTQDRIRQLF